MAKKGSRKKPKIEVEMISGGDVQKAVISIRGGVIHHCTFLEKIMDQTISLYFCKDIEKQQDLITFIICTERMTWMAKLDVFKLIIEKEAKKPKPNKFADFKNKFPNYYNDIKTKIIEERNVFAHQLLDSSDGYLQRYLQFKTIRFIDFKVTRSAPDVQYNEYTNEKILEIQMTTRKFGDAINKMNQLE